MGRIVARLLHGPPNIGGLLACMSQGPVWRGQAAFDRHGPPSLHLE